MSAENAPPEQMGRAELQALQLERMRWSLQHAYDNVPHYRHAFEAAGVRPSDLESLADLARFPFTAKQDLRDNYPYGLFAVPMSKVVRVHASSGTTGRPTVVGYTKGDIERWGQVMARSLRVAGASCEDIILNSYGYGLFTGGLGAHYGGEALGATVIPMGGGNTEKQIQLIQEFRPTVIMATPSYMLTLADTMQRMGLDPSSTTLRLGMFGAEPWTNQMRAEIERMLGIDAIDVYGLSEVMGPGVACEFVGHKDGPHIWEDHFYPEIIDPVTGEVLPDGERGELVFTSLTKEAMPVIRYRTRDLTRLLPPTARSFRRIGKITGRSDDMLIVRGVNVFPTQIEEQIMRDRRLSGNYQIVLTRDGHLDNVEIRVEVQRELSGKLSRTETENIARELQHHIKTIIGISTKVNVMEFEAIPRTLTGKARRVIDQRPKQL